MSDKEGKSDFDNDLDSYLEGSGADSTTKETVVEMNNVNASPSDYNETLKQDDDELDLQHALDSYEFDESENNPHYSGNPETWVLRNFNVDIVKWFIESWNIFRQHWITFVLFSLLIFVLSMIPFVNLVVFPLYYGIFIAVTNKIRYTNVSSRLRYENLVSGYLYIPPIVIALGIRIFFILLNRYFIIPNINDSVIIPIGILLFIIPALYVIFALYYAVYIFIEFHHQKIGIIGAMRLSATCYHKDLLGMTMFIVVNTIFGFSGFLVFGVGLLVTLPISIINIAVSFKDIFGLDENKPLTQSIVFF